MPRKLALLMNCGRGFPRMTSLGCPGPRCKPVVRNLKLDCLVPGLPVYVRRASAQQDEHRDPFSCGGPQHRERNLELRDTPDGAAQPRLRCGGPEALGGLSVQGERHAPAQRPRSPHHTSRRTAHPPRSSSRIGAVPSTLMYSFSKSNPNSTAVMPSPLSATWCMAPAVPAPSTQPAPTHSK